MLFVVLVASMKATNNTICKKILIDIKSGREHLFLNTTDIRNYISASDIELKKKVSEINIKNLEMRLERIAWIDNVEIFFDGQQNLNIHVYERQPLCRVFKENGRSFYIDDQMNILPLHNFFAANVPIFTGLKGEDINEQDSVALHSIVKLAKYIKGNSFWMAQIQQVVVDEHLEFEAIPTIGKHRIIIGDTSSLEAKFSKLMVFYNKVLKKLGFDRYKTINIQFKHQVVVSDSGAKSIDTASASNSIIHFIDNGAAQRMDTASIPPQITRNRVANSQRNVPSPRSNNRNRESISSTPRVGMQTPTPATNRNANRNNNNRNNSSSQARPTSINNRRTNAERRSN
jgi:cell division protein FtsQ